MRNKNQIAVLAIVIIGTVFLLFVTQSVKAEEYYEVYGIYSSPECKTAECGVVDDKVLSGVLGVQNRYVGGEVMLLINGDEGFTTGFSVFVHKTFDFPVKVDLSVGGLAVEQLVEVSKPGYNIHSDREFGYGSFVKLTYGHFVLRYSTYETDYSTTLNRTVGIDKDTGGIIQEHDSISTSYKTDEIWMGLHYSF